MVEVRIRGVSFSVSFAIHFLAVFFFFVLPAQAEEMPSEKKDKIFCQSESIPSKNPLFENVKQVIITARLVPTSSYETLEFQQSLPEAIREENILQMLKTIYERRFTTEGGRVQQTFTRGCYGRKDQPVTIYHHSNRQEKKQFFQLSKEEGVLGVYFMGRVMVADARNKLGESTFTFSVVYIRNDVILPANEYTDLPVSVSFKRDDLHDYIDGLLRSWLH